MAVVPLVNFVHYVFVYGTLKAGQPNNHWLKNETIGRAELVAKARTVERYPLVISTCANLPFLLWAPGHGKRIFGELYKVDDGMFKFLDWFEDYPDIYARDEVRVTVKKKGAKKGEGRGRRMKGWTYNVKKFPRKILKRKKGTFLSNYDSENSQGRPYKPEEDDFANAETSLYDQLDEDCPNLNRPSG